MPKAQLPDLLAKLKDKKWVEKFTNSKQYEDRLKLIRNYNVLEKEEEAVIQLLVDRFDPPQSSVTAVDLVRDEMAKEEMKGWPSGKDLTTAEGEAYWQEKLDIAETHDAKERKRIINEHLREIDGLLPDLNLLGDLQEEEQQPAKINRDTPADVAGPGEGVSTDNEKTEDLPEGNLNFKLPPKAPTSTVKKAVALKALNGMNAEAIEKLKKSGIINADQLFQLTYENALEIVGSPLVLDKLKDKFSKKQE